jgi:ADP-heptose:LPS heptosyltransferase
MHEKGGLGDVFMHRMILEDFKRIMPDAEITVACLPAYMDATKDHPCISEVADAKTIDTNNFIQSYNTCVTVADRYENRHAPCKEHRSDIWAAYCGFELTNHEMHLELDEGLLEKCRKKMEAVRKPGTALVALAPVSAMLTKTLLDWQLDAILDVLQDQTVVAFHKSPIPHLEKRNVAGMYNTSIKEWMCLLACADYVISVDTAAFHLCGGLKKPLMGIFTFADGKAYGKYFDFVLVQKHRDNGDWDCGPCFIFNNCPKCRKQIKPCLTELTVEELQTGVKQMFEKWPFVSKIS